MLAVRHAQPILEQESLPYLIKPYHLHDFLGKVSELLVETGTLVDPIRGIGDFSGAGRRQREARKRRSSMFAARDDYQMLEWERSEEEERKKREKEIWDREHL